jgi:hypothetical protein
MYSDTRHIVTTSWSYHCHSHSQAIGLNAIGKWSAVPISYFPYSFSSVANSTRMMEQQNGGENA